MRAMTKRRLLRWSLLLVLLGAFAVWLEPTRVVWGWLHGEAFYQGRPTSFWRSRFSHWEKVYFMGWPMGSHPNKEPPRQLTDWVYKPTWFDQTFRRDKEYRSGVPRPLGDDVNESAIPMLQELVSDNSTTVSEMASLWLTHLQAQPSPQ